MFRNWERVNINGDLDKKISLYRFDGTEYYLVRHSPFGFLKLNNENAEALKKFSSADAVDSKDAIAPELFSYINTMENSAGPKKTGTLRRLNLIVAQKCNCRCRYCYAGDGSYGAEGFMSRETAKKAIDSAFDGFELVQNIQFFGGEPLLAPELIEESIVYAEGSCQFSGCKFGSMGVVLN